MSNFKVEKNLDGDKLILNIHGQIDESAILENVDISSASTIIVNMQEVDAINSCGIREWIKWMRSTKEGAQIEYQNCPKIIVDQINMVNGFLPESAKVTSFYVPYYNEDNDEEKLILFKEGEHYSAGHVDAPEEIQEAGTTYELDVLESKYFKFLNR